MIYEANEPSSACRLWRTCKVETSTPRAEQCHYVLKADWGQAAAAHGLSQDPGITLAQVSCAQ